MVLSHLSPDPSIIYIKYLFIVMFTPQEQGIYLLRLYPVCSRSQIYLRGFIMYLQQRQAIDEVENRPTELMDLAVELLETIDALGSRVCTFYSSASYSLTREALGTHRPTPSSSSRHIKSSC